MDELTIAEIENIKKNFLTAQEVAQALGISPTMFYRNAHNFDFPIKRIGRKYVIPRIPFLTYLHNGSCNNSKEITTVCFGETRKWESRADAEKYFFEALNNSEGAEREHYANVLIAIHGGKSYCTDSGN